MNGTANNYIAGSLGIGTTSLTNSNLAFNKTITGAVTSYGIFGTSIVGADVTTSARYYATSVSTAASAFTLTDLAHFYAGQGSFGAGSTVTNQYGFFVSSAVQSATNNYGFFSAIPSGTNRWNLYMAGTAANYMAGDLGLGATNPSTKLDITGSHVTGIGLLRLNSTSGVSAQTFYINGVYKSAIFQDNVTNDFTIWGREGAITFSTGTTLTERMRIDAAGSLGIGATTINASARLQVDSTTQGVLISRMTSAQRTAIASPATGLLVYQTDGTEGFYVYSGGSWKSLTMV
jgi:hypothetical protein